jgi:L-iditol 2-dehydrogenase
MKEKTMKAAYLIGPETFQLRDVEEPQPPPDGLVLDVKACGVCGSDLRRWKEGPGPEPVIAGHEIAGVVSAVGDNVRDYRAGEQLAVAPDIHCGKCYYCQRNLYNLCDQLHFLGITAGYPGGFTEKMILTREVLDLGVVHRMPAGMPFSWGALAEPCSSVLASHDRACTNLNDTVLILGAGPIGCLHIAVAQARGARVILSEPSPIRREMAGAFRPDLIIDPFQEDLVEQVKQFTNGLGADIAVCANPIAATQAQAVNAVRKRGKVILFGGLPKANPDTVLDGNRIHYQEIEVVGAFSYHPSFHELAIQVIHQGLVPAETVITQVLPLQEIERAFQAAACGEALKVMIVPSGED